MNLVEQRRIYLCDLSNVFYVCVIYLQTILNFMDFYFDRQLQAPGCKWTTRRLRKKKQKQEMYEYDCSGICVVF